jgi:hypothetical protein
MYRIKTTFISLIILGSWINVCAGQYQDTVITYVFPDDWLGIWEGTLDIYKNQKIVQSVPMRLEHLKTDSSGVYIWAIIYGEDKVNGRRSYELKPKDISKGHYVVDEKNGILLDGYVFANKYISNFEVMGNQLTSIYERNGDYLIFEIIVNTTAPIQITGNVKTEGEETIPEVKSFQITGYQTATLKKRLE